MTTTRIHRSMGPLLLSLVVVASVHAQVPVPRDHFGFQPGDDHKLADYSQILSYFQALDAASDRVVLQEIGKSSLGKPMIIALISSEANLKNRSRYQEISRRLALARGVDEPEARRLAKEGKAIIWIDNGLHATEVAPSQHAPLLAHWLITAETEEAKQIRDNAILILMPSMNPDGLDIVANWYRRNVGTPFETAPIPEIYHHYVGHDNNRDWYMFTQVETQAVARVLYHEWFPQLVYNHHQSGPFPSRIWGPPFAEPLNPNLDPLVVSSLNQIGEAMRKRFDEEGKPGYSSHVVYDLWWNGSMRGGPDFHNMLGFLTETALFRYATPRCYPAEEIPDTFGPRANNMPAKDPSMSYTNPWRGGCWHLRDAVDYIFTGSKAVLAQGARMKEDYLYNIHRMGTRQIARGEKAEGGPFAYVIDLAKQHDPTATMEFLRLFRLANIEIRQADQPFTAGGQQYPAGTYVIPPQPFRPYVVDLMEPKTYPERRLYPGGPPEPPYDMTGYELSLQMGIAADRVKEPFTVPARIVDNVDVAPSGVHGQGSWGFLLSHAMNASVKATNRLLASSGKVSWASAEFEAGGQKWPAGTIVVQGATREALDAVARSLGLNFYGIDAAPSVALSALRVPKIGLYRSHMGNMDEGWTRWLLEQYGFPFTRVTDTEVRSGRLSELDILVLADESESAILTGHTPGTMPPEYVGGMGVEGAAQVKRFVEGGGWLLALDRASDFAITQLGLPIRNTVKGLSEEEFFIPGSLVSLRVKSSDPLGYGMPEASIAFFVDSQAFAIVPPATAGDKRAERNVTVFAEYAQKDFLASGWELGGRRFAAGRAAGVRVPVGQGQVVLFAFRPHFRGQPHNTYKLLFNTLQASVLDRAASGAAPRTPSPAR